MHAKEDEIQENKLIQIGGVFKNLQFAFDCRTFSIYAVTLNLKYYFKFHVCLSFRKKFRNSIIP